MSSDQNPGHLQYIWDYVLGIRSNNAIIRIPMNQSIKRDQNNRRAQMRDISQLQKLKEDWEVDPEACRKTSCDRGSATMTEKMMRARC